MSTVLDDFLLYQLSKLNETEVHDHTPTPKKVFKNAILIFIILTACGLFAFGLSNIFFYFYDEPDSLNPNYPLSLPSAANCGKRIVGYYTGWEQRKISENQISKLTHVIFVAVRVFRNGQVGFHNPEYSGRFLDMKKKARRVNGNIKVLIGVGGKGNSRLFSPIFADKDKRKIFIASLSKFLESNKIDGLEITWTMPFAEQKDRENIVAFFKQLREEFTKIQHQRGLAEPYIISLLTPQIIWKQIDGYDLDGILKYADFLNVFTFEYYGPWGMKEGAYTGPVGPLYGGRRGNIDDTMKVHTCETKKPSQLTLGIQLYGKFWRNVNEKKINHTETMCEGEICRVEEKEDISDIWRMAELKDGRPQGGFISWNDKGNDDAGILFNKTEAKWDDFSKSSYIWKPKDRTLLIFETERSIREKVKYAVEKNLGGINLFSMNMDDEQDTAASLVSSMEMCTNKKKNEIMYKC